jgi:hypothetical protein
MMALPSFFSSQTRISPQTEEDRLMAFVKNYINREDLIANELTQWKEAQTYSVDERSLRYLPIYFALENFLIKNRPLIVKQELTKDLVRDEVRKNIDISQLDIPFRLVFYSGVQQKLLLFETGLFSCMKKVFDTMGKARVLALVSEATNDTILKDISVSSGGVDFRMVNNRANVYSSAEVISAFKKFYVVLFRGIRQTLGEGSAIEIFSDAYHFIITHYDDELISQFIEVLPTDVLESERIMFLGKEQVEKRVDSAVKEEAAKRKSVEHLAEELKEKIEEIERLNKLMIGRELKMAELKEEMARLKGGKSSSV